MTGTSSTTRPLVILGGGYTGAAVYNRLRREGARFVSVTSRIPDRHLLYANATDRVAFDLAQPHTWNAIPARADVLWCFPAEPVQLVTAFAEASALAQRRLVVLGSTSAYQLGSINEYPPAWVDEGAPIDLTKPRVLGEEHLRKEYKAIVLRVAGIYGKGRNPLDWIRKGRVGPSRKYMNLIHVEDLATICLAALERGTSGEVYNVSDGTPRTWESICQEAARWWKITPTNVAPIDAVGKRIRNTKLLRQFGLSLQHPDLMVEVDRLERGPGDEAPDPRR